MAEPQADLAIRDHTLGWLWIEWIRNGWTTTQVLLDVYHASHNIHTRAHARFALEFFGAI